MGRRRMNQAIEEEKKNNMNVVNESKKLENKN